MTQKKSELQRLQTIWDAKLKASGFVDAENRDGNLKSWHNLSLTKPSRLKHGRDDREAVTEYYRLAGQFLHSHQFRNKTEKKIWELHSDGKSVKEFRGRWLTCKEQVYQILNRLIQEMKDSWKTSTEE